MTVRFALAWSMVLLLLSSPAATLTLDSLSVGTIVYSNVIVLGANSTDLYFKHQQGIANVKLKYLSTALQKRFGYDKNVAAQEEKKQSEMDALYQKSLEMNLIAQATTTNGLKQKTSSQESFADPISSKSLLGKPAPALNFETWLGERPVLNGRTVLLSFWEPWSFPCRKCIPELNALQKRFPEKLVVVGVCSESESEVSEMPEPRPEFSAAIDAKGKLASVMGITSVPCVVLLDTKGVIQYEGHPNAITEAKLQVLLTKPSE